MMIRSLLVFTLLTTLSNSLSAKDANGVITLIDVVNVPAERAGVLVDFTAKEGSIVAKDQSLAKIDDSRAVMENRIARLEWEIQQQTANNTARIRAAESQAKVSAAEYDEAVSINDRVAQAIPLLRVRRLKLSAEHANLEAEVAQIESHIDHLQQNLKGAQLEASQLEVERCELKAPLDGVVVERYKHAGEWVSPGESVLQIVRLDQLRIEWLLKVADIPPHQVAGRELIATVQLSGDDSREVKGVVSFVSPLVEATGEYRVWCDVENIKDEQGNWLLRAGLEAKVRLVEPESNVPSTATEP